MKNKINYHDHYAAALLKVGFNDQLVYLVQSEVAKSIGIELMRNAKIKTKKKKKAK